MTQPLCSVCFHRPHRYYGLLRPCASHRYTRLRGATTYGFSLGIETTGSHVPHESLGQDHAAFIPDAAQAASRSPPELIPGGRNNPGFDVGQIIISIRHQRFTLVRLPEPHLTRSRRAFSVTLTTLALDQRSLRWFGTCPCRPVPRDLPSSFVQLLHSYRSSRTIVHSWHTYAVIKRHRTARLP